MATHVFDLTGVELPTSEAQLLEEDLSRGGRRPKVYYSISPRRFPLRVHLHAIDS